MSSQDESSRKPKPTRKKNKMAQKKANKTIKARDLKPAKDAQRSFPMVVQQDHPQLNERIDAARDRAGFDDPLALQLNIVPGSNFFWD
jgi:hypothetical protein